MKFLGILILLLVSNVFANPKPDPTPVPVLKTRSLDINEINFQDGNYVEVGNSSSSAFDRILFDEQDDIETEILNAIGNISIGADLYNKKIHDGDYNYNIGFDLVPKRRVYPVNFGTVRDGVPALDPLQPTQDPKSGFVISDSYRTAIHTSFSTADLINKALNWNGIVNVGDGIEFGQVIQKTSVVRSSSEYLRIINKETKASLDEINSEPKIDPKASFFETTFEAAVRNMMKVVNYIYTVPEKGIQELITPVTQSAQGELFREGLFAGVKLKQALFSVSADKALHKLVYGDVLSMTNYWTSGPSVGVKKGIFDLNWEDTFRHSEETRVTRLPINRCNIGPKQPLECNKVLVTFVLNETMGPKIEGRMGVGFTNFKAMHGRKEWAHFFQTEKKFRFNLTNKTAAEAFAKVVNQIHPDQKLADLLAQTSAASGVTKESFTVFGDEETLKLIHDKIKTDYIRTGKSNHGDTAVHIGILTRKANSDENTYKKCVSGYNEFAIKQKTVCTFEGMSQKSKSIIVRPHIIQARNSKSQGMEAFAVLGTPDEKGNFISTSGNDSQSGVNIHFYYRVNDLITRDSAYKKDYLVNTKAILGVLESQTQSLYQDRRWKPVYDKVMVDLSDPNRNIKGQHQTLSVDLYMNSNYTNVIFAADPNKVRDAIAEVLAGTTWDKLSKLSDNYCQLNPRYAHLVLPNNPNRDNIIECSNLKRQGQFLWETYLKLAGEDEVSRLTTLTDYYSYKDRTSAIPLLMLMLGGDLREQVTKGNLGLRFKYAALDLIEKAKPYDIGDKIDETLAQGYVPLDAIYSTPNSQPPRLFDLKVYADKRTIKPYDPKVYLIFSSTLGSTMGDPAIDKVGRPFQLSGFASKHVPLNMLKFDTYGRDVLQATFKEPILLANQEVSKLGEKQFKYIVELTGLRAAGFISNQDYIGVFNLEDPDMAYPNGENEHFSEMVRLLLRIPNKI